MMAADLIKVALVLAVITAIALVVASLLDRFAAGALPRGLT